MHTEYLQWPQEMSVVISACVAMEKAWHGAARKAVNSRAGTCIQYLGAGAQGKTAPPISSQGMPLRNQD